ncbi:2454_t:CDS:2, partial [Cetraspora pellucida]
TYLLLVIFHITLVPSHWYLKPNITSNVLFQQIPAMPISISEQQENVNNPIITRHKEHPSKRLKLIAEETSSKSKYQLKDNMLLNIINKDLETGSNIKEVVSDSKSYKYGKYKEYSYYAKTCDYL